jgi:carbonic anhydrase
MRIPRSAVRLLASISIAAVALVVPTRAASPAQGGPDCHESPWSYHPPTGPAEWPTIPNTCFRQCAGGEQSPIDLKGAVRKSLPPLVFSYGAVPLQVVHTGHDIRANLPKDLSTGLRTLRIGGVAYKLEQFHFHTLSEHTVNGQERPIEMHMVHEGPGGRIVVVGVFIVPGPENPELSKIWKNLPKEPCQHEDIASFDLRKLLPRSLASYRYAGSLTTPACDQGVDWNVLAAPITLRPEQIKEFQAVFSGKEFPKGNRRPEQKLHGRELVTDVPRR